MALISPGVETFELDIGGSVAEAGGSPTAAVIDAKWGPVDQRVSITSLASLEDNFHKPVATDTGVGPQYLRWFTVADYLGYGGNAIVARAVNAAARNAVNGGSAALIKNKTAFDGATVTSHKFVARYPGVIGDSLCVSVCTGRAAFEGTLSGGVPQLDNSSGNWSNSTGSGGSAADGSSLGFEQLFDGPPGTSDFVANNDADGVDEMHIVVYDKDGLITGEKNKVLETFGYVSKAADATGPTGGSIFYETVINTTSKYIYAGSADLTTVGSNSAYGANSNGNTTAYDTESTATDFDLAGGVDGSTVVGDATTTLNSLFTSREDVEISGLLAPHWTAIGDHNGTDDVAFVAACVTIANSRKDCIVFASPDVMTATGIPEAAAVADASVTAWTGHLSGRSSYVVIDSGWHHKYDRFNDVNRWVPLAGHTAGIYSRLARDSETFFSPAGFTRGVLTGVGTLAWNPSQTYRDTLYKNNVNPIVNFPGRGTVLFGDKTYVSKPGSFDRINIRSLFILLRKSVAEFAEDILFETNDAFTRSIFVSAVDGFLANIQSRRGLEEYRVVADTSNNTATVLNNNQFVADIFVRPLNSINYIRLNFVSVRSGVEFSELAG